ncbi:MAG: winged helix-turn-helix transcriptional regulator [Candidatus Jordarchaeales archaeon]
MRSERVRKGVTLPEKILDDVDRKIIAFLRRNGRAKLVDLSKAIGFTSMGVKKRVARLINRGIISVTVALNKSTLNLEPAFIRVAVDPQRLGEFVASFEECPRTIMLFVRKNSAVDISMLVFGETRGALNGLLSKVRDQRGVMGAELQPLDEIYYTPYLSLRVEKMLGDTPPCRVNCSLCSYYTKYDCPGCPVSPDYKGPL